MKQCSQCKKYKEESEYQKRKINRDGLHTFCRLCLSKLKARYRDKKKEYDYRYYRTKKYREKAKRRQEECRKYGSPETRARQLLQGAVRTGRIKKPNKCEDCGQYFDNGEIDGHHLDYELPYYVEWLCAKCHSKKHPKLIVSCEKIKGNNGKCRVYN